MTGMKDAWASGAGLYRAAGLQAQRLPSEQVSKQDILAKTWHFRASSS